MWFKGMMCTVLLVVWFGNGFALPLDPTGETVPESSTSDKDPVERPLFWYLLDQATEIMARIVELDEVWKLLPEKVKDLKEIGLDENSSGFKEYVGMQIQLKNELAKHLDAFERYHNKIVQLFRNRNAEVADFPEGPEPTSDASSAGSPEVDNTADTVIVGDRSADLASDGAKGAGKPWMRPTGEPDVDEMLAYLEDRVTQTVKIDAVTKAIDQFRARHQTFDENDPDEKDFAKMIEKLTQKVDGYLKLIDLYEGSVEDLVDDEGMEDGDEGLYKDAIADVLEVEGMEVSGKPWMRPTGEPDVDEMLAYLENRVTITVKKIDAVTKAIDQFRAKQQTVDENDPDEKDFAKMIEKLTQKVDGYLKLIDLYEGSVEDLVDDEGVEDGDEGLYKDAIADVLEVEGMEVSDLPGGPEPTGASSAYSPEVDNTADIGQ